MNEAGQRKGLVGKWGWSMNKAGQSEGWSVDRVVYIELVGVQSCMGLIHLMGWSE